MADMEDGNAEVEERLVNEEYKIWKKNTPFLYGESSCCVAVMVAYGCVQRERERLRERGMHAGSVCVTGVRVCI